MSSERNKALSQELYEAVFGHGDLGAADRLMAPGCVSHPPGLPAAVGTDAIKLQAQVLRAAFPDLVVTLLGQVAEGDRVASHWRGAGTHTGPMSMPGGAALPPTGRRYRRRGGASPSRRCASIASRAGGSSSRGSSRTGSGSWLRSACRGRRPAKAEHEGAKPE